MRGWVPQVKPWFHFCQPRSPHVRVGGELDGNTLLPSNDVRSSRARVGAIPNWLQSNQGWFHAPQSVASGNDRHPRPNR